MAQTTAFRNVVTGECGAPVFSIEFLLKFQLKIFLNFQGWEYAHLFSDRIAPFLRKNE